MQNTAITTKTTTLIYICGDQQVSDCEVTGKCVRTKVSEYILNGVRMWKQAR